MFLNYVCLLFNPVYLGRCRIERERGSERDGWSSEGPQTMEEGWRRRRIFVTLIKTSQV